MVAELDRGALVDQRRDQPFQGLAPLDQRRGAEVEAVEVDQVEGEIGHRMAVALRQRLFQQVERGDPARVLHHHLAVEDGALAGQLGEGLGQRAVAARPVVAVAGDQPHLAVFDEHQGAVAVVFDLVQPARALRRRLGAVGQLRLPLRRHRRGPAAGDLGGLARRGALALDHRLVDRAAGDHAVGLFHQHVVVGQRPGGGIAFLDQQPVGRVVLQPHQRPAAG